MQLYIGATIGFFKNHLLCMHHEPVTIRDHKRHPRPLLLVWNMARACQWRGD